MGDVTKFKACDLRANQLVVQESDFDAALAREAALREELNEKGWDEMMTRLEDQNESLRQRLTAAEQRNAELVELLRTAERLLPYCTSSSAPGLIDNIKHALKPTESGASE